MNVALPKTKAESAYLEAVSAGEAGPRWLEGLRRAGYESFAGTGLPHRRLEDWKWFDLRQIVDRAYPPALRGAAPAGEVDALIARSPFARLARARLVFVNGVFDAARSQLPASGDVEFVPLASDGVPRWLTQTVAANGSDPISALNAAFVSDGGALRIAAGATADAPIELLFVTTAAEPSTLTTRNVIVLEEGASATLIETHLGGAEAYVANSVTEARLGKGSRLDRVKLEAEGESAIHLANFHADVGENATLRDFTLTIGGRAVRQQGFVTVSGEGADVLLVMSLEVDGHFQDLRLQQAAFCADLVGCDGLVLGRLLVDAVTMRDYPVIQTLVLLFSLEFILINLVVDLLYGYINPTIRYK